MAEKEKVREDMLGREIRIGDYVAYSGEMRRTLSIGKIIKISEKMIRVMPTGQKTFRSRKGTLVYPKFAIKLDGSEILVYILKME